jgi:hypothetical protein
MDVNYEDKETSRDAPHTRRARCASSATMYVMRAGAGVFPQSLPPRVRPSAGRSEALNLFEDLPAGGRYRFVA